MLVKCSGLTGAQHAGLTRVRVLRTEMKLTVGGVSEERCNWPWLVEAAGDDTAVEVIAKAFSAGFQRMAQRARPRPVGSRDRVTR